LSEINGTAAVSLSRLTGSKRHLFRVLILALLIGAAYVLLFAPWQRQTLSIVVKPCGSDSTKAQNPSKLTRLQPKDNVVFNDAKR
jgi:hypothetical protein